MGLILLPVGLGLWNVLPVATFVTVTKQADDGIAVFGKVDAITSAKEEA
jgi:hypothetical protein